MGPRARPSGDTQPLQQVLAGQRLPAGRVVGVPRSAPWRSCAGRPQAFRRRATPLERSRHPVRALDVHHRHGSTVREGCDTPTGPGPPVASLLMILAASNTSFAIVFTVFVVVTVVLVVLVLR